MSYDKSIETFEYSRQFYPGGIASSCQLYQSQQNPVYINRAKGAWIYDLDNNSYIDYLGSFGAAITGYDHPDLRIGLDELLTMGIITGVPTDLENLLVEKVIQVFPSLDWLRLVNSERDALQGVILLTQHLTGRENLLWITTAKNDVTLPIIQENILTLPYNDLISLEQILQKGNKEIAGVIIEPVDTSTGLTLPEENYLQEVRRLTQKYEVLLIFNEIVTGFRLALGGAQELYGVLPDLTCLGRVMGGGFYLGGYGGSREVLEGFDSLKPDCKNNYRIAQLQPQGQFFQVNPLALGSGIITLNLLQKPGAYDRLWLLGKRLEDGLNQGFLESDVEGRILKAGSIFHIQFTGVEDAKLNDQFLYRAYRQGMLNGGIYLPPIAEIPAMISLAHSESEIDETIEVHHQVLSDLLA